MSHVASQPRSHHCLSSCHCSTCHKTSSQVCGKESHALKHATQRRDKNNVMHGTCILLDLCTVSRTCSNLSLPLSECAHEPNDVIACNCNHWNWHSHHVEK